MNENSKDGVSETDESSAKTEGADPKPSQGPTFNEAPDPLAGVKKTSQDVWDSMEGKTVSMRTYVGSIVAVIVLMLLARCGG